jgi:hypothetical protein
MSRGPGWVERAIAAYFEAEPSRTFSTDELVEAIYHDVERVEKKHRVAVLRAADNVIKRMPGWQSGSASASANGTWRGAARSSST